MFKRFLFPVLLTGLMLVSFSCSLEPTYTKDNILQGVKDLLLKEFDIRSEVKIKDTTIGVCVRVPRLFVSAQKASPLFPDIYQNIMLCLRRVLLSTNVDIQFFQINFRGDDTGIEISFLQYLRDLKILLLSGISFDDYQKRRIYKNMINIADLGKKKLENFFADLGSKKSDTLIAQHFTSDINKNNISPGFVTWLWESLMKMNVRNEIKDIRMVCVDENSYYFYCKVRETFDTKNGFQNSTFATYSGGETEYVFEMISLSYFSVLINRLFLLKDPEGQKNPNLLKVIEQHGAPQTWPKTDFFVSPMTFNKFLAEQIAGRILVKISEENAQADKNDKDKKAKPALPRILSVKADYEDNAIKIIFIYNNNRKDLTPEDEVMAKDITKTVLDLYKYEECKILKMGTLGGTLSTYPL